MNDHPLNLAVRFLLEMVAIVVFAMWGWKHEGMWKYILAIGIPLVAMTIWGVFRVPGDPKDAPVAVKGIVRLVIETLFLVGQPLLFFLLATKVMDGFY